jgi:CubicO group peptidase (beta-lactamase class C family)
MPYSHEVADPAELGVDPATLDALVERARREIDSGLLPSCQLALARHGRLVLDVTLGDADPAQRYVIFSCTKALVAGVVWQLIGEGRLDPAARVAELIPEFATNGKDVVTVEQLLTHTAGFPTAPLDPTRDTTRAQRLERFARWRLNWEPGTRFEYHPTSAHWVLGELIERVTGTGPAEAVRTRLADPLGLTSLRLGEPPDRQGDVAELVAVGEYPTPAELEEAIGIPGIELDELVGEVTIDALLSFNDPAVRALGVPGGGGISRAADLALYYQALLENPDGMWDPAVLAAGTAEVRCDLPDPLRGVPSHRSLGLMIAGEGATATLRGFGHGQSPRSFGHGGAGGQIAWADPDSGLSFCYLTNGLDRHLVREGRRIIALSSRAAACAPAA